MDPQLAELVKNFAIKSAQAMQWAHALISAPRSRAEAVADELIKLGYIDRSERNDAIEVLSTPNGALEVLSGIARLKKKAEGRELGRPYSPSGEKPSQFGAFPLAIGDDFRADRIATEAVARRLGLI